MNKTEIILESVKIANEKGLHSLTVAALAKSFQVKPPSLYKHIKNLQEVHDELGILCMQELIGLIQAEGFARSGDDALRQFCISSRQYALFNPGLYRAMQQTHVHKSARYQKTAEALMEMLAKLVSYYDIKKQNHIHTIRHLRCLLHGFIDLELQGGFGMPDEIDLSFELAIENFISSLKHKKRSTI